MQLKAYFGEFFRHSGDWLHCTAHSHHPWPDVTRAAQLAYWEDAVRLTDRKWDKVFGEILPEAQGHIAGHLHLPQADQIVFAPNTHEFVVRLYSCLDWSRPQRVLTTAHEFHSFARQTRRLEETGRLQVTRVAAEPYETFVDCFCDRLQEPYDLVWLSQVFFDSGFRVTDLERIVQACPPNALVVVDGYHAFGAFAVDLAAIAERAFYLAGGYKYVMAGEGACFLAVPPENKLRPLATGWFADFQGLGVRQEGPVGYDDGAMRFFGATFDPSGLYRFNAVMRWLGELGIDFAAVHLHVERLQARFLASLAQSPAPALPLDRLVPPAGTPRGNFLTFALPWAAEAEAALIEHRVSVDRRADRLRFGFGVYHDDDFIETLLDRVKTRVVDHQPLQFNSAMSDQSYLQWPFFEPTHQTLATRLDEWASGSLQDVHQPVSLDGACRQLVKRLGKGGWLRYAVPAAYGGETEHLDSRSLCLIRETLARHAGLADFAFAMQGLGAGAISLHGSEALKRRYLPKVAAGKWIAAFALSEPEAGSDVAAMTTSARLEDGDYVLDGTKTWISNGGIADFYTVVARTGEAPGAKGLSAFVVDADAPGLEIVERINVTAPHPLATLRFHDCRVPAENRVGEAGAGFKVAMATLDVFRASVGAAALGFARRALDEALTHARNRRMFGQVLADFQLTQAAIADMVTTIDSSALLIYRAAWLRDVQGVRTTREAAMAKLAATEGAQQVIDRAVQIFGGLGVKSGEIVEQLYREIRPLRIYEGASEVQKLIIARETLKG